MFFVFLPIPNPYSYLSLYRFDVNSLRAFPVHLHLYSSYLVLISFIVMYLAWLMDTFMGIFQSTLFI